MNTDLMSINQSRITTVLNCRVGVDLKGRFTLLASEKGMNVSQLLSTIVEEAVEKKNEEQVEKITQDRDMIKKQFKELQIRFDNLQQDYDGQSEKARNLEENNRTVSTELKSRLEELNACKHDLEASQDEYKKCLQIAKEWVSTHQTLKKEFQISEQRGNASQEKVKALEEQQKNILLKNSAVIKKLEKEDQGRFFDIPEWAWKMIRELPTAVSPVSVAQKPQ